MTLDLFMPVYHAKCRGTRDGKHFHWRRDCAKITVMRNKPAVKARLGSVAAHGWKACDTCMPVEVRAALGQPATVYHVKAKPIQVSA